MCLATSAIDSSLLFICWIEKTTSHTTVHVICTNSRIMIPLTLIFTFRVHYSTSIHFTLSALLDEFSQIPQSPNNFHFFLILLPRKNHWMKPHLFCSMQYLTKLVDLLLRRLWRRQSISCITHQPFIILSCALRQNGSFTRRFSQSNYRFFLY